MKETDNMKILPLLYAKFALFFLAAGIIVKNAFLISGGALLLLLVFPALADIRDDAGIQAQTC